MAKTERDRMNDDGLEAFFSAARTARPTPSDALLARIMADAETEISAQKPALPARAPRPSRLGALLANIGGWPALAGMATATVAGVWIGFAAPDSMNDLAGGMLLPETNAEASYELEDMLPGYAGLAGLIEEG